MSWDECCRSQYSQLLQCHYRYSAHGLLPMPNKLKPVDPVRQDESNVHIVVYNLRKSWENREKLFSTGQEWRITLFSANSSFLPCQKWFFSIYSRSPLVIPNNIRFDKVNRISITIVNFGNRPGVLKQLFNWTKYSHWLHSTQLMKRSLLIPTMQEKFI